MKTSIAQREKERKEKEREERRRAREIKSRMGKRTFSRCIRLCNLRDGRRTCRREEILSQAPTRLCIRNEEKTTKEKYPKIRQKYTYTQTYMHTYRCLSPTSYIQRGKEYQRPDVCIVGFACRHPDSCLKEDPSSLKSSHTSPTDIH